MRCFGVAFLFFSALIATQANAQFGPGMFGSLSDPAEGIKGDGSQTIKLNAQLLRMTIKIEAQGTDVKSALLDLEKRRKKALATVEKLGAIQESIQFESPELGAGGSSNSRQKQMIQRMLGNDPRAQKLLTMKPATKATIRLTADWKIDEGDSISALLIQCSDLRSEIEGADIASTKDKSNINPAQVEMAAEMEGMMSEYGYGEQEEMKPGAPQIYFVSVISQDDYRAAMAQAFKIAQKQAMDLAAIAGVQTGKLVSVSSSSDIDIAESPIYSQYEQGFTPTPEIVDDGSVEAVGMTPTKVEFSVQITARFELVL